MGKPRGGTTGASIFTSNITGPAPGPYSVGNSEYIPLGTIPTGQRIWFGSAQYTSPDKSFTFEIRTSLAGQSAGTDAATKLLASVVASPKNGTVTQDYYKSGTLHIVSNYGSGIEKFWLRLKSTSGSLASYMYAINYTVE